MAAEYNLTAADLVSYSGLPSRETVTIPLAPEDVDVGAALIEQLELTDTGRCGGAARCRRGYGRQAGGSSGWSAVVHCRAGLGQPSSRPGSSVPLPVVVTVDRWAPSEARAVDGYSARRR